MVTDMENMECVQYVRLGAHYYIKWQSAAKLVLPFVDVLVTRAFLRVAPSDVRKRRTVAVPSCAGRRRSPRLLEVQSQEARPDYSGVDESAMDESDVESVSDDEGDRDSG